MKKLLVVLIFTLGLTGLLSATESTLYAKALPIQKITSYQQGYKVVYFTAHGDLQAIWVPLDWFYQVNNYRTSDGFVKAEIVRGTGPKYPFLQIFWKDGKFHHLRLFVVDDYNDISWGTANLAENAAAKFDPAKDPDFQF